LEIWAK